MEQPLAERLFDNASGSLIKIIDRNGNTTELSYDVYGRLIAVIDPSSRHLYFEYPEPSSQLVRTVSSDIGVALSYHYDTASRLVSVTRPDQTTLSFEYDSRSLITAVKDSQGKVLEAHTYDTTGRGLSSVRADGIESLTLTYTQ